MENEESLDSPFNFYQSNLPTKEFFNQKNNILTYSEIYNSRNNFSVHFLNGDNNILILKYSLDKIAMMIDIIPEDYISFTNYKEDKITSLYLFKKHDNIIQEENIENNEFLGNTYNEDNNDIEEGFKKVENLEDNLFDSDVYKRCFCFYLFLIFCAIWDFLFYLYIIITTVYKSHFFTIYTLILTLLALFTGIFGIIKCKNKDFSGYILKICTILVPIFVLLGIIIYLSSDVEFELYWVKIIIDIFTMAISLILIAFVTGLIKAEIIQFNNNSDNTHINQNLINEPNNEIKEQNDIAVKF